MPEPFGSWFYLPTVCLSVVDLETPVLFLFSTVLSHELSVVCINHFALAPCNPGPFQRLFLSEPKSILPPIPPSFPASPTLHRGDHVPYY